MGGRHGWMRAMDGRVEQDSGRLFGKGGRTLIVWGQSLSACIYGLPTGIPSACQDSGIPCGRDYLAVLGSISSERCNGKHEA